MIKQFRIQQQYYSIQKIQKNINIMMETKKSGTFVEYNSDLVQNLKKKRPNLTKLDIEKLFQQSIQLTQLHRKLYEQNQKLKKDYEKVEQSKLQRQQFISQVQNIVKQKSKELSSKNPHQSSWLVFKLHQKIFDLKQQIEGKDKTIRKLVLSKENQTLFRKQTEVECLRQINEYAQSIGILPVQQNLACEDDFQEIVWMDEYLQTEKMKVEELESELEQQQRQTKRILTKIANKKIELKKMKQMEREFHNVQQSYIQQKKKKQQKLVDSKGYLTNLIKERDQEAQKLTKLKQKRVNMENQQKIVIIKLQEKLEALRKIYEENKNNKVTMKQKSDVCIKQENSEQWVKRVALSEVDSIAKNMNLCLALKGVTQQMWIQQFFKDKCQTYSIENVMSKLQKYPFQLKNAEHRKLLARYVVEDNNPGLMLQDLNTSQDAPIIKSILCKIIGSIKVYSAKQIAEFRQQLGTKLGKFWPLVEQCVHIKEGVRNIITKSVLEQGIQAAEIQLTSDQIDYAVLFLFSWSRDINKLELNKLGKIKELGINFNL